MVVGSWHNCIVVVVMVVSVAMVGVCAVLVVVVVLVPGVGVLMVLVELVIVVVRRCDSQEWPCYGSGGVSRGVCVGERRVVMVFRHSVVMVLLRVVLVFDVGCGSWHNRVVVVEILLSVTMVVRCAVIVVLVVV